MNTVLNPNYPTMAWYAQINPLGEISYLEHGSKVLVKDDFFFEGIFNGELNPKGLSDSNLCLGSGYTYSEGKPTFITPSHTLEGLFLIKNAEKYFVSNSNVIAYSLANLTPSHNAVKKGWRIKYGLKQVPQVIEKSGDIEITKISFYNFSVIDYELVLIDKSEEPDFSDFNEYYSYLLNQGMKLMSNYEELNGKPIDVVSTVSTGFDSVACLGIAKQLGCKYALTLRSGRGNVKDEGSDIAKAININCKIYSRPFSEDSLISRIAIDYLSLDKCSEFVAAGTLAEDVCYLPFEDSINDTLLLTGFQGDRVWSKTLTPTSYLDRGDVSGSSMGEFRLRAGFIHWPLPFIGCRKNELLLKITLSDEMKPYTTESNYNKPISIRIADIAKIPRSLYGVRKKAASVLFDETPSALPVAIYSQQVKYGLRNEIDFEYSPCVDLCATRNLYCDFNDVYHSFYAKNIPELNEEIDMLFYSRKIDFFVFGRTIALIHFDADCGSYYVDALGGIIAHISDNNVSPRILDDFQLLKQNILSNLRDFSNSQKQFVHFTYNKESETIRSIYDEELSFENKPNDYLSSIWQEKTGVI